MPKQFLTLLSLILFTLLLSNTSYAKYEGPRWTFGVSGHGEAIWVSEIDDCSDCDTFFGGAFGGDIHFGYRFSNHFNLRLTLGGMATKLVSNNILPNIELTPQFYLTHNKAFNPYLLVGIGLPKLLHAGIGGEIKLNDKVSFFTEAIAGSILFYNSVGGRAGINFHF